MCFCEVEYEYIDEMESSVIQAMLVPNFKKIFAMHMVSTIKEAIRHNCEGCQLELPSQLDHKHFGENVLTHLNTYWAEALKILCHSSVVLNTLPGARQKGYLLTSCLSPRHSTMWEVYGPRTLRDWQ